jgi:DNA-binding transcriptional LysR family regulator
MTIDFFKEFIVLATALNYWEAADILDMGESTLSKHIKKAEKELGVQLFFRNTKKVEMTDYGKIMLPFAEQIISQKTLLMEQLNIKKDTQKNRLLLGTLPSLNKYGIADIIAGFKSKYPMYKWNISEGDPAELREKLRKKIYEIVFSRESMISLKQDDDLEKIPLIKDRIVAVLPRKHQMVKRDVIDLKELKNDNFILLDKRTFFSSLCYQVCNDSGFAPNVIFECQRVETILEYISRSIGIGLLTDKLIEPPGYAETRKDAPYIVKPITTDVETVICMEYLKKGRKSAVAQHFIQYFNDSVAAEFL